MPDWLRPTFYTLALIVALAIMVVILATAVALWAEGWMIAIETLRILPAGHKRIVVVLYGLSFTGVWIATAFANPGQDERLLVQQVRSFYQCMLYYDEKKDRRP